MFQKCIPSRNLKIKNSKKKKNLIQFLSQIIKINQKVKQNIIAFI